MYYNIIQISIKPIDETSSLYNNNIIGSIKIFSLLKLASAYICMQHLLYKISVPYRICKEARERLIKPNTNCKSVPDNNDSRDEGFRRTE